MSNPANYKWPIFPSPFGTMYSGGGAKPKSARELEMMKMSAAIRRKISWFEKMNNSTILNKWREEAKTEGLTDNQISYVLQELHYYASLRDPVTGMEVSDVDGVWYSDSLIDETLRKELVEGVKDLEDIPEFQRDYHPGTKKQVWNLVHPSLYPIMYGKTRVVSEAKPPLKFCGAGQIISPVNLKDFKQPHASPYYESEPESNDDAIDAEILHNLGSDDEEEVPKSDNKKSEAESESEHEEGDEEREVKGESDNEVASEQPEVERDSDREEQEQVENEGEEEEMQISSEDEEEPASESESESESDDDDANADENSAEQSSSPEETDDQSGSGSGHFSPDETDNYVTSQRFTWLPTDFIINNDNSVKIASYINNLHPEHHKHLYRTLEKIFSKFVPIFENVLQDQLKRRKNRIQVTDWYAGGDDGPDNYDDSSYSDDYRNWEQNRALILPDAPAQFVPLIIKDSDRITLAGKTVQVIVKLANIVLTPAKPEYKGGVWHVEGMKNENIVASGIYYYDVENISDSSLAFRQKIVEPGYAQGDDRGVYAVYKLGNHQPLNQLLGSVFTPQSRCLGFPNFYQHQVQPFKLIDRTKPGHRKILVFFLVDPGKPIVSTTTVPPQQLNWYVEELLKIRPFCNLPIEIVENIVRFLDWPVTIKKAKKLRRLLMKERKYFVAKNNEDFFARPFSLCEH